MRKFLFMLMCLVSGAGLRESKTEKCAEADFDYCAAAGCASIILREEVEQELAAFCYLLKSSYAGYDDAANRGLDLDTLSRNVSAKCTGSDVTDIDDFAVALIGELRPYMNDVHFSISTDREIYKSFKSERVLFSDIFVEKRNGGCFVISGGAEGIAAGTSYDDSDELLFPYPSRGENCLRVGHWTIDENETVRKIRLGGQKTEIRFSLLPAQNFWDTETQFREAETEASAYIKITDFVTPSPDSEDYNRKTEILKSYAAAAKKYIGKKNIILDLRGNPGGDDEYSLDFIESLLGGKLDWLTGENYSTELAFLVSKPIADSIKTVAVYKEGLNHYLPFYKKHKKVWVSFFQKSARKAKKPAFEGTLYVLADRNTASSGESSLFFAKCGLAKTKQIVFVGENTAGCLTYGNIIAYRLPISGLLVTCSSSKYQYRMDGTPVSIEGRGFSPDYWAGGEDMAETLVRLTGDEELRGLEI